MHYTHHTSPACETNKFFLVLNNLNNIELVVVMTDVGLIQHTCVIFIDSGLKNKTSCLKDLLTLMMSNLRKPNKFVLTQYVPHNLILIHLKKQSHHTEVICLFCFSSPNLTKWEHSQGHIT